MANQKLLTSINVLMTDTLSPYTSLRTQFNGVEVTPFLCSSGCGTSGLSFTTGSEVYNDINNLWNHTLTSGGGACTCRLRCRRYRMAYTSYRTAQ